MRYGGDDRLYVPARRIRTRSNTALRDFDVEAKREEQRNCLKHLVGRIDVFAILPTHDCDESLSSLKGMLTKVFDRDVFTTVWLDHSCKVKVPTNKYQSFLTS